MPGIGIIEIFLVCAIALVIAIAVTTILILFLRRESTTQSADTGRIDQHGALGGLEKDDHPQYLRRDGSRQASGDLNLGGNHLENIAPAVSNGQAVPFEQSLKIGDDAGGDLFGTFPTPQVTSLQGHPISSVKPSIGQVLVWNGSEWEPQDLP